MWAVGGGGERRVNASFDPELDLEIVRENPLTPEQIWRAWTAPDLLKEWFCPLPWTTIACEMDLQPGGIFHTVMQSPHGQAFPNTGCILAAEPNRRLVFTTVLGPGYRPGTGFGAAEAVHFTAFIEMEPLNTGSRYHVTVCHGDAATRIRHEEMGFHGGWNVAFDQMIEVMSKVA